MTGSTHQPPLCRLRRQQPAKKRAQAVRSERPHNLLSAPLGSGWTPELFAAWSLSRFSNVWIFGPNSFQCLDTSSNAVSSRPLAESGLVDFHPRRVSSAVFAVLRKLHTSKAVTSNLARLWRDGPQEPPGNSPRVCAYGANVAAICLFGGKKDHPQTLARGMPAPKNPARLKTASIGLRRRELRPQTRSRIIPWPPSRQGYFAPASRDAILLDGVPSGHGNAESLSIFSHSC